MVTLGVADLAAATNFYESVLAMAPTSSYEGVTFIELPGTWLVLYPLDNLAHDISEDIDPKGQGFPGITLAHNAASREDVVAVMKRAEMAGARIVKEAGDTFWGGFNGYFRDPDGYYWEIAWGPMFAFTENGELKFKDADN